MNPWGLIQNLPRVRHKVRSALYDSLRPNIPFSGPILSKNLSSDEKVVAVEQRLLSLEFFLKEYVVSVNNIVKDDTHKRNIEAPTEKGVKISEN